MLEKVRIVGCGTIGSNLAIAIAQHGLSKEIHLYDFDIVDRESKISVFPITPICSGLYKTQIIQYYINYISNDIVVFNHNEKIDKPLENSGYVIDCRDRKDNIINADIRLSLDNHVLIIDTTDDIPEFDFSSYCLVKKPEYIITAVGIIIAHIQSDRVKKKMKIMYDLDGSFVDYTIISPRED